MEFDYHIEIRKGLLSQEESPPSQEMEIVYEAFGKRTQEKINPSFPFPQNKYECEAVKISLEADVTEKRAEGYSRAVKKDLTYSKML